MSRRAVTGFIQVASLYLLLGLVATWAMVWGSAAIWQPDWRRVYYHTGSPSWRRVFVRSTCPGGEIVSFDHVGLTTVEEQKQQWDRLRIAAADQRFGDPPLLAAKLLKAEPDGPFRDVVSLTARGWPWRASLWVIEMEKSYFAGQLRSSRNGAWCPITVFDNSHNPPPPPIARGCIQLTSDRGQYKTGTRLPLLPHWPGLIADTLFFAAVFAGAHQLVGFGRRCRRRRLGACATCGYDLTGIDGVCPECGRERERKA